MTTVTAAEWDRFLLRYPDAHILQTSAWGTFKTAFGWQVERVVVGSAGSQILFRSLPLGFQFAYIPKGPVGSDWAELWPVIDRVCRRRRAVLLKVEPDLLEPVEPSSQEKFPGFHPCGDPIQPQRTILIDLNGSEEDILTRMKPKTRYNIRLAQKKDIQVRAAGNVDTFYQLMQATGQRDQFGVHSLAYFQRVYDLFSAQGMCELLLAEYEGRPLAGLMVFSRGKRAWYFYGASNEEERNRMPAYLLQWEAMLWARARGCSEYDLWGVPDEEEETLEAHFTERIGGLWSVYRFKRGFGGQLVRSAGAWDRAYLPFVYPLYQRWARRRREAA
jgi:peptidoglycan pentaglycine glycine transferase (the first glycine)